MRAVEKGVVENSNIYFHTPSTLAKTIFYYLICAGEFMCNNNYHVKRESYNSYLLMFVKKGQGTVCYENKIYQAKENDLIFINCFKPHEYFTKTGWETKWIHFDGNNSEDFFNLIFNQYGCVIPLQSSLAILEYFGQILDGFKSSQPVPEPLVSCYIHRMLSEMLLFNSNVSNFSSSKNLFISKAIKYIETNFQEKLSLEQIASHVQMSVFHFSRQFKKEIGYSPYEFITKTRIDHAKVLLKKTDKYIKEIAFDSGFSSESNFVFTFRKNTGMSPSEFRNMQF